MPIDDGNDEVRHVNRLDATGTGDVVQARDVHGGVHIHRTETAFAVTPSQLPGDVRGFVNRHTEGVARIEADSKTAELRVLAEAELVPALITKLTEGRIPRTISNRT